jgi:hypothetical protein
MRQCFLSVESFFGVSGSHGNIALTLANKVFGYIHDDSSKTRNKNENYERKV